MQPEMNLYELTKKYGAGKGEDMMWKAVASISEAVEKFMPADQKHELMRKIYGDMSGGHYNEEFAAADIAKMYYTDRNGEKHAAPYWPSGTVREIYESIERDIRPYTACDFEVTMNMVASDNWPLLEKWFPGMSSDERNAKTVELAVNWLNDPDAKHPDSKIWNYFN